MPTQIFSLRIMDDDDDDDDDDGVRKQIDGAFPLSLLRLPTHRPSILSSSRRHRIIGGVWFKTELRALLFSKYYTTTVVSFSSFILMSPALFSFFSFAKSPPLGSFFEYFRGKISTFYSQSCALERFF